MNRIDGALGMPELPSLVVGLRDRLAEGDLALDLTGLAATDAAGLQLLLSARLEAAARGHALTLRMPKDGPVVEMIARLGLEHAFDLTGPTQAHEQETAQ